MKTASMIFLSMNFLLNSVTSLVAQTAVEVSYVTSQGSAYLKDVPEKRLVIGQELKPTDTVVLDNGARIRLHFPGMDRSEKYAAPATIVVSKAIKKLEKAKPPANRFERAKKEIGKLTRQYIRPKYSAYAGTRALELQKDCKIHEYIPTFLRAPHIVIHVFDQNQKLTIHGSEGDRVGEKITEIPIVHGMGILWIPVISHHLNYGETYFWNLSGEENWGRLEIIDKEEAQKIQRTTRALEEEVIDEIEKARVISAYLADEGFWAEAYVYVQRGLGLDPDDPVLQKIRQAILSERPADIVFKESLKESGVFTVHYSFHIKDENELREIYDGGTVHTGDLMQISVQTYEDCYLFILNQDAGGNLYVLFPFEGQSHALSGGRRVGIPGPGRYYKADRQTGEERLYLIASKEPLDYFTFELDRYFSTSPLKRGEFELPNTLARGFSALVEDKGKPLVELAPGSADIELSRFLEGKGLLVKEIRFKHVE